MNDVKEFFEFSQMYFQNNISEWYILNFVLGMCVASFIGLVVARWPAKWKHEESKVIVEYWENNELALDDPHYLKHKKIADKKPDGFSFPASRCDSCENSLKLWHNIPIIGWLYLKGKCAFCGTKIPASVLLAEVIGGGLGVLSAYVVGDVSFYTFGLMMIIAFFCATAWLDWNTIYLPVDAIQRTMWIIVALSLFLPENNPIIPSTLDSLKGLMVGYLILPIIEFVYLCIKLFKIKEGFGGGDKYLMAALGSLLGVEKIIMVFILSIFIGVALFIITKIYNYFCNVENNQDNELDISENKIALIDGKQGMPFGPSIVIAGLVMIADEKTHFVQNFVSSLINV